MIVWRHKDAALLSQRLPGGGDSENAGQKSGFCKRKCPGGAPLSGAETEVWERNVAVHRLTDARSQAQGLMHRCPRLWHGSPGTVPFPRSPRHTRVPPPRFKAVWSVLPVASRRLPWRYDKGSDSNRGRCHLSAVSRDASDPKLRRPGLPESWVPAAVALAVRLSEPERSEERSTIFGSRRESSGISGAEGRG